MEATSTWWLVAISYCCVTTQNPIIESSECLFSSEFADSQVFLLYGVGLGRTHLSLRFGLIRKLC